jgi:peptidoglycan/xylan/chitin deacetylase (PgdA/CDA1 family)
LKPFVVPILLYHSVSDAPPDWIAPFTVSPEVFARHLELISSLDRQVLSVSQMADRLEASSAWSDNAVVLTFDDGFADMADVVAPALAERGFPATLYVTTGVLSGRRGPRMAHRLPPAATLEWRQLPALEDAGIEIGAHTQSHPALDVLSPAEAFGEVRDCKRYLEDELGHEVRSFAYPHGHHDQRVISMVQRAGYHSACAVKNALSSTGDDRFALSRLTVMTDTPIERFGQWLHGKGAPLGSSRRRWRTRLGRQYRRLAAREWR